jgi:hypothetical protein
MSSDNDAIVANDRVGNEVEVVQYCKEEQESPVLDPPLPSPNSLQFSSPLTPSLTLAAPSASTKFDEEAAEVVEPAKPVFATEVFQRMVFATVLALGLQWGTTGASVLIHLFTPPKGMGCRALTFIIFGSAGTLSFLLHLFSSIFAHLARRRSPREQRSGLLLLAGYVSTLTRWLGKTIAIMNGFGLLLSCGMQFAGMYDNCFCSSTIFGGVPDGLVKFVGDDIKGSEVYGYWIGGTVMAFIVSALYTFAIYVATPMG